MFIATRPYKSRPKNCIKNAKLHFAIPFLLGTAYFHNVSDSTSSPVICVYAEGAGDGKGEGGVMGYNITMHPLMTDQC